jgi:hypothetical protein
MAGDFMVQAEGAKGGNVPLIRLYDPTSTRIITVYRLNQSSNAIGFSFGGAYYTTTAQLPLNTWHNLSVRVHIAGSAGTLEIRLDGGVIYSSSTANLGTAGVGYVQLGNETTSQAFTLVADNVTVTTP